jgi:hypothetical protein
VDYLCDSLNSVATGIDDWPHDGWIHSCPAGRRHRRRGGPTYSGTKNSVAVWTLAGEGEVSTERSNCYEEEG